jgi:hypothetical protein
VAISEREFGRLEQKVDTLLDYAKKNDERDAALSHRLYSVEGRVNRIYWVASFVTLPFTFLFKLIRSKHGS